jgi:glycosyltransferase involved in cell wall biosynthesis
MFRSAPFLPELVERLRRLDPAPDEIVFLDDASPDEPLPLLRRLAEGGATAFRYREVGNAANGGIAAAYNRLAREARSEWVHILDADDYPVESDFYARIAGDLRPGRDLVVAAMDSNSTLLRAGAAAVGWAVPPSPPRWLPLLGSFATRAGVIYRRELLLAKPFPDPAFPGSDVLHFLSLRHDLNCAYARGAHVHYRVHASATSSGRRSYREYRRGLAQFGLATRLAHELDLGLRVAGQAISRRRES